MSNNRFVIIVLDGLRPDLVTPERMPNLAAFKDQAATLAGSRALYPSHTRVNKTGRSSAASSSRAFSTWAIMAKSLRSPPTTIC
jgi:hypothetical protein